MLFGKQLEAYLAWKVHGRKPPEQAKRSMPKRRATQRKGPPRDDDYKAWIRTLPCVCCGKAAPSEAAHTGAGSGMSQKASDYTCVPLCAWCHTLAPDCYHAAGGKRRMERRIGETFVHVCKRLRARWRERKAA